MGRILHGHGMAMVYLFLLFVAFVGARPNNNSISSHANHTYGNIDVVRKVEPRRTTLGRSNDVENYFDPFGDLKLVDPTNFFTAENKKKDFYAFTEANIKESKVAEWYAEWSKAYLASPDAATGYEWEDFFWDVGNHPNFICTIAMGSCTNTPSLAEIDRTFSGYPHYARRVYFVAHMFTLTQARAKTILRSYESAQLFLTDHIAEIVHNMQLEPDNSKAALCALIHELVEVGIQLTLAAASAITEGAADALVKSSQQMAHIAEEIVKSTGKAGAVVNSLKESADKLIHKAGTVKQVMGAIIDASKFAAATAADQDGSPLMLIGALQQKFEEQSPKFCPNVTVDPECHARVHDFNVVNKLFSVGQFGGVYRALLGYERAPKGNPSAEYRVGNPWDTLYLTAGSDNDALCNRFEGGLKVNTQHNINELKFGLSNKFAEMRDILTGSYERYYNGSAITPGGMSETASILTSTKWTGASSTVYDMHMLTKWQNEFELQMAMKAASVMGSNDFSHVICTRTKEAPDICGKAARADKPCKKAKGCLRSVFCPEPSDPELICKAQKWYGSPKAGGHITRFPSAEKWEKLMGDRYHLTQRTILQSVWEHYKAYHNDFNSLEATWGTKSNNKITAAGGFHLPVCYKDGINIITDKFPASCGDWRSSETEAFMTAAFMGPYSQLFNEDDGNAPGDLITNVLPTVVDNMSSSPIARYFNFCALGIRWPNTSDREDPIRLFKMHRGQDKECGMIQYHTQSMDEESANAWFCTNGSGTNAHSVFEREHPHIAVGSLPFRFSHRKICKKWNSKLGGPETGIEMKVSNSTMVASNATMEMR